MNNKIKQQAKIVADIISRQEDFEVIAHIANKYFKHAGMSNTFIVTVPDVDYKKIGNFPPAYVSVPNKDVELNLDILAVLLTTFARHNKLNEAVLMQKLSDRIIDIANSHTELRDI